MKKKRRLFWDIIFIPRMPHTWKKFSQFFQWNNLLFNILQDYYDVSLVDGYNLPMMVDAGGGSGACGSTGCIADLNQQCPNDLRVGNRVGCKSACEAFQSPEYCCSGAYASPATCKPSVYSQMFKSACPKSYSYAYDDATSTFTCTGADYTITFCPSTTR